MLTFPQVVVGEHTVGGLDDLLSADKSGLLIELTSGS
jgi:glutaredoxin